jgi:hypothetical protein
MAKKGFKEPFSEKNKKYVFPSLLNLLVRINNNNNNNNNNIRHVHSILLSGRQQVAWSN